MKKRFDPRKLMELAIKVMRQSVSEPRKDGKASPLVGAALIKPDGAIETASRGELRHGDHAEFTLLERKNRHNKLDYMSGSISLGGSLGYPDKNPDILSGFGGLRPQESASIRNKPGRNPQPGHGLLRRNYVFGIMYPDANRPADTEKSH